MARLLPILLFASFASFGSFSYGGVGSEVEPLLVDVNGSVPPSPFSVDTPDTTGVITTLPCVLTLLNSSCPAAIIRGVTFSVVDPIDRVISARSLTHIGVEVGKIIPPFANSYTSAAVVFVAGIGFTITPRFHAFPCAVFRGKVHTVYTVLSHSDSPLIVMVRVGGADTPSVHYKQVEGIV